jgi:hypothetical protein
MAYDRIKIFEQAKELIVKHKLFFVEDVIAFLPCVKSTFYDLFPEDSNESNELKDLLNINKIEIKTSMRSKWYKSDNPTLQMALMKLICSNEERKKLAMNYTDITTNGEKIEQPLFYINKKD